MSIFRSFRKVVKIPETREKRGSPAVPTPRSRWHLRVATWISRQALFSLSPTVGVHLCILTKHSRRKVSCFLSSPPYSFYLFPIQEAIIIFSSLSCHLVAPLPFFFLLSVYTETIARTAREYIFSVIPYYPLFFIIHFGPPNVFCPLVFPFFLPSLSPCDYFSSSSPSFRLPILLSLTFSFPTSSLSSRGFPAPKMAEENAMLGATRLHPGVAVGGKNVGDGKGTTTGVSGSSGGGGLPGGGGTGGGGGTTEAMRVAKTLKREAESLWDIPPDTYGSRACGRLSVPAQLVAVAVLGSFQFGYNLAALNTSKAFVILNFGWCKYEDGGHYIGCDEGLLYGSLVTTAVFVGAAVGCLAGGRITDFGRRMAILCTHCLCILGSGLSAGAEGFVSLLLARLVVGVSVGLFTVCVPMYIAEVTPDHSRGFFGTFHQLFITIGIFCGTVLGLAFGEAPSDKTVYAISTFQKAWWRVLLGFPLIVSLVAVCLYLWVFPFETPNFMMERKQRAKAAALLREIYGRPDVEAEMHRLLQAHYEMKIQRAQQLNLWKAIVHHSAYRHVIIIACLLSVFQQFSGINVLVANSNNLYVSLKLPSSTITGLTVGFSALNVVLTVLTVPLVDTLGRRTLLLFSMIVQFVAMAVAFVANLVDRNSTAIQWTTVGCVYVFIVGFAVGYGPILWIYLHEIFPPEIKQGAAGLASALNWVATVCIVLPSDFLLNSSFTVFVGICTFALLFILIITVLFVKETKGLSIEDSPYFKGKHRAISGSAFADKLNPSFFYGQEKAEEGRGGGLHVSGGTGNAANTAGGGAGTTPPGGVVGGASAGVVGAAGTAAAGVQGLARAISSSMSGNPDGKEMPQNTSGTSSSSTINGGTTATSAPISQQRSKVMPAGVAIGGAGDVPPTTTAHLTAPGNPEFGGLEAAAGLTHNEGNIDTAASQPGGGGAAGLRPHPGIPCLRTGDYV